MQQQLNTLLEVVANPGEGLPEELFLFISRVTPLINVDLLIQNAQGETLLTWRDDEFYGPGWHIPGGIIRFKETAIARVHQVARSELGATVSVEDKPLAIHEIMSAQRDVRGHFISMLYRCRLTSALDPLLEAGASPTVGQWRWHRCYPSDMVEEHECYRAYF